MIAEYLLAGVISWGAILAGPFLLIEFSEQDLKRRILEHEGFSPYVYAALVTTLVVAATYGMTPWLLGCQGIIAYGILAVLWIYSAALLLTALRTALAFLKMVQSFRRLEKDLREGVRRE